MSGEPTPASAGPSASLRFLAALTPDDAGPFYRANIDALADWIDEGYRMACKFYGIK